MPKNEPSAPRCGAFIALQTRGETGGISARPVRSKGAERLCFAVRSTPHRGKTAGREAGETAPEVFDIDTIIFIFHWLAFPFGAYRRIMPPVARGRASSSLSFLCGMP